MLTHMSNTWSDLTSRYLRESPNCPRCDDMSFSGLRCSLCGADFRGAIADELAQASARAAAAIELRQRIIDRAPAFVVEGPGIPPAAEPGLAATPVPDAAGLGVTAAATKGLYVTTATAESGGVGEPGTSSNAADLPESQISVQSVLAVAGAGLVAVAAIVFTFFNPDLSDFSTRTAIVGGVTLLFLAAAVLLARRRLRFSAEAVAALGAVFVVLDLWALSNLAPGFPQSWIALGAATAVTSAAMIAVAALVRLRVWLWLGLVGVSISPAMFGFAADAPWASLAGHLGVGFVSAALVPIILRLGGRFGSLLRADRLTSQTLRILVVAVVVIDLAGVSLVADGPIASGVPLSFVALASLSAAGALFGAARFWAFLAGAFAVIAVSLIPLLVVLPLAVLVAVLPIVAAIAACGVALYRGRTVPASSVHRGAWTVAVAAVLPIGCIAASMLASATIRVIPADLGIASIIALLGFGAATTGIAWIARRRSREDKPSVLSAIPVIGVWTAVLAILSLAAWTGFSTTGQVGVAVLIAVLVSVGVLVLKRFRPVPSLLRAPSIVLPHVALFGAAVLSWTEPSITVAAGVAILAALVLLARTVPGPVRVAHVATGFAFALVVFARALDLAGLDAIPVLCLTTSLASTCALTVTLLRRIPVRHWYAVLGVTAVPFLLGIVSVLLVRSGWTALSTAVTFALALTLVLTRRPGLNRWVRSAAAALLVPALAVVVVCLGAQVLLISASPVTLPVIALIVAVALPVAPFAGVRLARRIPAPDARSARFWIEASSYLTGVLAVVLALVRAAAGLGTTLVVLLVIGLGAACAGAITRRAVPWVVAGASGTGALWSLWGLGGIDQLEAYLVPPALAAIVIGVLFTLRRRRVGRWFFSIGLVFCSVPSFVLLVAFGSSSVPWRMLALAGEALVLLVVIGILARRRRAAVLAPLRIPTLLVAMLAAIAPAVQAVRWGLGLDPAPFPWAGEAIMVPILALSASAFAITLWAGRLLAFEQIPGGRQSFPAGGFEAARLTARCHASRLHPRCARGCRRPDRRGRRRLGRDHHPLGSHGDPVVGDDHRRPPGPHPLRCRRGAAHLGAVRRRLVHRGRRLERSGAASRGVLPRARTRTHDRRCHRYARIRRSGEGHDVGLAGRLPWLVAPSHTRDRRDAAAVDARHGDGSAHGPGDPRHRAGARGDPLRLPVQARCAVRSRHPGSADRERHRVHRSDRPVDRRGSVVDDARHRRGGAAAHRGDVGAARWSIPGRGCPAARPQLRRSPSFTPARAWMAA